VTLTEIFSSTEIIDRPNHDVTIVANGYVVGLLPLACKKFTFFAPTFFIVYRAGPPNMAGPGSLAVSATMVSTPLAWGQAVVGVKMINTEQLKQNT